jgi:hypothetical protein
MKMIDSIKCEPYGYIKYEHNDTNHIIIEEVEDVKINIEDIKKATPIKDLTLHIPTNIILNKLNTFDITNIIFDFVGHISPIVNIIPTQCYTKNKTKILEINKYIINNNQDIITSTIKENHKDINIYKSNNCIMYMSERYHISYETTYMNYEFKISPDLTNTDVLNYLMEIGPNTIHNKNYFKFKYLDWNIRATLLSYDIKQNTITLNMNTDYNNRQSNPYPTRRNTETFNIDSISECILEYNIIHYIDIAKVNAYEDKQSNYYKNKESNTSYTKQTYSKPKPKSNIIHNNDNIDFID